MSSVRSLANALSRVVRGFDRGVKAVFRGVLQPLRYIFFAFWNWARTRSWIVFLQGFPALAAIIAVTAIVMLRYSMSAQEIERRYLDRAQAAFQGKDYATAMVCYERLADMGQDRPENLYEMAIAFLARGEDERAFKIMNQIAPDDHAGYGLAHEWMAMYHWPNLSNPQSRKLIESHLKHSLEAKVPDDDKVNSALGELYYLTGKHSEAETHLRVAVLTWPPARLLYAKVLSAQDKKGLAKDQANLAANFYKDRIQDNPKDKASRINLSVVWIFLEKFQDAIDVLNEGYAITKDADYLNAMAAVCFNWQSFVAEKDPDNIAQQLALLEEGLKLSPTNVALLDRVLHFLGSDPQKAAKAREVLKKAHVKGEVSAMSHFILGMEALQTGNSKDAIFHWEASVKLNPNLQSVNNNLAWLLLHEKNPNLSYALELSQRSVKSSPNDPRYLDTRARIYMKMEKWDDARHDLETITRIKTDYPAVHEALAEVYSKLDRPDFAERHRRAHEEQERKNLKKASK